jgi:hypothetical protein
MLRSAARKVLWVGRTASTVFGLALVLALIFGAATVALGATGGNFILGKDNSAGATTRLTSAVAGPVLNLVNRGTSSAATALNLSVPAGRAPLTVNSSAGKATNLNVDKLDGKDSSEIGLHGLQRVYATSASNSDSPKRVTVNCPSGKVIVGTGADLYGGTSGTPPNEQTDVVINKITPTSALGHPIVYVEAYEESLTSANWQLIGYAICATAH